MQVQVFPAFEGFSTFGARERMAGVQQPVKCTKKNQKKHTIEKDNTVLNRFGSPLKRVYFLSNFLCKGCVLKILLKMGVSKQKKKV